MDTAAHLDRILITTDGSEYSEGAKRVGIALAKQFGARLTAITAEPMDDDMELVGTRNLREAQQAAAQARVTAVREAAAAAGLVCETLVEPASDPYRGILVAAEETGADLIVMGRRGRRGLARWMVGDATEKVAGQARCAVLAVPRASRLWQRRILFATDASPHAAAALELALALAKRAGLPMTVMSVMVPAHSEPRRAEGRRAAAAAARRCAELGIACESVFPAGRPHECIAETAAAQGADLIVIGSHGRTGIGRILLGSNAARVIGSAPCAVLIGKPPA
ncbi:MAG: universal stress protein [Rhodocyclaceae bacterium]